MISTSPAVVTSVARLAQFFPDAVPVRIPVSVMRIDRSSSPAEETVIEFGTPDEVFFASESPLEFAETVRLSNADGSLQADARVVAVQWHNGHTAVAARFSREVRNWIVKK
jgi:hypothetical protein